MMRMTLRLRFIACVAAAALVLGLGVHADAPFVYAIRGARVVTVTSSPISNGTVVIRNGLIDAVGADVQPPADAVVIDGAGLTVYPGLIDMGSSVGLDIQVPAQQPQTVRSTDEAERWKRSVVLRADVNALDHVKLDAPEPVPDAPEPPPDGPEPPPDGPGLKLDAPEPMPDAPEPKPDWPEPKPAGPAPKPGWVGGKPDVSRPALAESRALLGALRS